MYATARRSAGGRKVGKVARLLMAVRRLARKDRMAEDVYYDSSSWSGRTRLLDAANSDSELDDDCNLDYAPNDVPAGCLAVYVGEREKRYVIPAAYLRHGLFRALLDKSVEEFGYHQQGGLHIPCQDLIFEHLLLLISSGDPASESMGLSDLLHFFTDSEGDLSA